MENNTKVTGFIVLFVLFITGLMTGFFILSLIAFFLFIPFWVVAAFDKGTAPGAASNDSYSDSV